MSSVFPIILNSTNSVPGSPDTFTYKFPRGSVLLKNASVGVVRVNMYYSWGNINKAKFDNSEFSIFFPDSTGIPEHALTIPDGNYTVEDINSFIQQWCILNNKYFIETATGKYIYFIELKTLPQQYLLQLLTYDVPTTLPTGYTAPTGGFSYPAVAHLQPALRILNNNFGDLIGFDIGSHYTSVSSKTPQMNPVSSVLMTCSLINNKFTNPNNIIFSFITGGTVYGGMINNEAQDVIYNNIDDGYYSYVTIKFIDNLFRPLNIIDTNLVIYLIVRIDE